VVAAPERHVTGCYGAFPGFTALVKAPQASGGCPARHPSAARPFTTTC
jgi:hypothetical protein